MKDPLKQGLKQKKGLGTRPKEPVEVKDPLKQGLKQKLKIASVITTIQLK